MTFGRLIFIALGRNGLRSLFTFAAIVAAFCLFGALETIQHEREGPTTDLDVVIVQPDGSSGLPRTYEDTLLAMKGVKAAIGISGVPVENVKMPSQPLIILAANEAMVPATLTGMRITPAVAARWRATRIGAICDVRTAKEMGWKVGDRISLPLLLGMRTASGESQIEAILLGTYPAGLALDGLLIREDYLSGLLPQNAQFAAMFVRPAQADQARSLAQRIDDRFQSSVAPTLSEPMYEARQSAAKDAATVRMVTRGALAISFFTMVLIVTNALTQSVRERLGEMAVMEALGFQRGTILSLVVAEALVLFAAGALLGLALASVGFHFQVAGLRSDLGALPWYTVLTAIACAVVCALISALLPGWELSKLRVADALRRL